VQALRNLWLWIPDLPPAKSAAADLKVSISGTPEIDGNPE
jgi:hypothetical protein